MIRFLRRLLVFVLLLGIAATGLLWLGWQYEWRRDPMPLLDRGPATYRQVGDERMEVVTQGGESRIFHRITLEAGLSHPVRFTVSLPVDSAGPLPAVLILGGFEIGQASLGYIAHHGWALPYWPTGAATCLPSWRRTWSCAHLGSGGPPPGSWAWP